MKPENLDLPFEYSPVVEQACEEYTRGALNYAIHYNLSNNALFMEALMQIAAKFAKRHVLNMLNFEREVEQLHQLNNQNFNGKRAN